MNKLYPSYIDKLISLKRYINVEFQTVIGEVILNKIIGMVNLSGRDVMLIKIR